jgi:predicted HTH domain antitoxin
MRLDTGQAEGSSNGILLDIAPATANHHRLFIPNDGMTAKSENLSLELTASSAESCDAILALANRYISGGISIGRAAEIVGICYEDFIQRLSEKGLRLPMGPATLEEFREEDEILKAHLRRSA